MRTTGEPAFAHSLGVGDPAISRETGASILLDFNS